MQHFSPQMIADRYGVAKGTVITWCVNGSMPAINVAGSKARRNKWRISEADIAEFERRRKNAPEIEVKSSSRCRQIARPTKDYFPNL